MTQAGRVTPTLEATVLSAYRDSPFGAPTLAKQVGVSSATIYNILKRHGVSRDVGKIHNQRASHFRLTPEQNEILVQKAAHGISAWKLAKEFGVSRPTVLRYMRIHNIPRIKLTYVHRGSSDQVAEVARLYATGITIETVARRLGLATKTAKRWLTANGVAIRPAATGPSCSSWKGGRTKAGPYTMLRVWPNDPHYSMARASNGYALEHRMVMARNLGRVLESWETVHHINGDGHDNRLENLQLRQGRHGNGVVMVCGDCGSNNLVPERIA